MFSLQEEEEIPTTASKKGSIQLIDEDGDSAMDSDNESDITTTGEPSSKSTATATPITSHKGKSSPPQPSFSSIGSPTVPTPEVLLSNPKHANNATPPQLKSAPGGDAASDAVKVEGLMDTSESPLRL